MNPLPLYPLQFDPIYQHRLWGGRRLASLFSVPLPGSGPIGELWLLSDRDEYPSLVANGPLRGQSIGQLLEHSPMQLLGKPARHFRRFPLLLKLLDVQAKLSVQVHPSDQHTQYLGAGERGKTEAWVVLLAGPQARVYAGLKPSTTAVKMRRAIVDGTVAECLASFTPRVGDAVFLRAGTLHSLGDAVVFEVQQNSDVTFRLYDWNQIDAKTGLHRSLQVDEAMACITFPQIPVQPVIPAVEVPQPSLRERLFLCEQFGMWRLQGESPFMVGAPATPRVIVCLEGEGSLVHNGTTYPFGTGDLLLLPAVVGACQCRPGHAVTLLEISLPV
jgi:mannose-6-phosphate isomerase